MLNIKINKCTILNYSKYIKIWFIHLKFPYICFYLPDFFTFCFHRTFYIYQHTGSTSDKCKNIFEIFWDVDFQCFHQVKCKYTINLVDEQQWGAQCTTSQSIQHRNILQTSCPSFLHPKRMARLSLIIFTKTINNREESRLWSVHFISAAVWKSAQTVNEAEWRGWWMQFPWQQGQVGSLNHSNIAGHDSPKENNVSKLWNLSKHKLRSQTTGKPTKHDTSTETFLPSHL